MLRTLLLTVALSAAALPVLAETTIKVDVTGLDNQTAHARILAAAQLACRTELANLSPLEQYYSRPDCISTAVAKAESAMTTTRADASASVRLTGR